MLSTLQLPPLVSLSVDSLCCAILDEAGFRCCLQESSRAYWLSAIFYRQGSLLLQREYHLPLTGAIRQPEHRGYVWGYS